MKTMAIATVVFGLSQANAFAIAPGASTEIPAECKNLALMQTQLIETQFHNNTMGAGTYNPSELVLKTNNGYKIGKIEYLGGDGEDETTAGKYACDLDKTLCNNFADAGGSIDWARVTVNADDGDHGPVAEVVVSMGGRGGCIINSSKFVRP